MVVPVEQSAVHLVLAVVAAVRVVPQVVLAAVRLVALREPLVLLFR